MGQALRERLPCLPGQRPPLLIKGLYWSGLSRLSVTETPFKLVSAQREAGTESMEPMAGAWRAVGTSGTRGSRPQDSWSLPVSLSCLPLSGCRDPSPCGGRCGCQSTPGFHNYWKEINLDSLLVSSLKTLGKELINQRIRGTSIDQ